MGVFVAIPSGAGVALGVLGKLNLYFLPRRYNKRSVTLVIFHAIAANYILNFDPKMIYLAFFG